MAILAGIDEAGYGPILGPLVVSACTFQIPNENFKADLWQLLKKSVSNKKKHLAGRLLICDSKKAFNRKSAPTHLERTTLSTLKCLNKNPQTIGEIIDVLSPECKDRMVNYPWYKNSEEPFRICDDVDIRIAAEVFCKDMSNNNIKLFSMQSACLDVAYYNNLINAVNNKANVLFSTTCSLIKAIWDTSADQNIQIIIDRQGGRTHYRRNLQRMFSGLELAIINESDKMSSYQLNNTRKKMRLHFVTKADQKYLPVSLSSMLSKYIRELLVQRINQYFLNYEPRIKPTAGYWKDGLRFINDLKTHLSNVKYDPDQLIRCR